MRHLVAWSLLFAPALVCAQTPEPEAEAEPAPREDDPAAVTVLGARPDARRRFPGAGTFIGQAEMSQAHPTDAAEMLRRVPGVQSRQDTGGGGRFDLSIRGLDAGRSRRVLMLEDGMPMALNPYGEPDMYFAPTLERHRGIEVVKGSGNILFGPQTLAGTIQFITVNPPAERAFSAEAEAGNYGFFRGFARYGDTVGGMGYLLQGVYRRGDGFRQQPFASADALGKLAFATGAHGDAVLKLTCHRDDADSDDVGLTRAMYRDDPRRSTLSPDNHLTLNMCSVGLTQVQHFGADTRLTTLAYAYRTERVWRRPEYDRRPVAGVDYGRVVGDASGPEGGIWFRETNTLLDRTYDVIGLEPRAEHRFTTGVLTHEVDFGGRLLHESADYRVESGAFPRAESGALDYEEAHGGQAAAAYLQDRVSLPLDFVVTPGVRVEHFAYTRRILRQDTGAGVTDLDAPPVRGQVTGVVPGVGLLHGTARRQVFGGVHAGFAPPRVNSANSARGVDSEVHADRSVNYELGGRLVPVEALKLEATGFYSDFSNQVIVNTNPNQDNSLVDAGSTDVHGVESAATLDVHRLLEWQTRVRLGLRYTWLDATFRAGPNVGRFLPYAPRHAAGATADAEATWGLGGQLAYGYVGEQFADAANTTAEDATGRLGVLEARHVVDGTLFYHHRGTGLTARLTVKNLLGATYVASRRPEGIFVGAPTQALLSLRMETE